MGQAFSKWTRSFPESFRCYFKRTRVGCKRTRAHAGTLSMHRNLCVHEGSLSVHQSNMQSVACNPISIPDGQQIT